MNTDLLFIYINPINEIFILDSMVLSKVFPRVGRDTPVLKGPTTLDLLPSVRVDVQKGKDK